MKNKGRQFYLNEESILALLATMESRDAEQNSFSPEELAEEVLKLRKAELAAEHLTPYGASHALSATL